MGFSVVGSPGSFLGLAKLDAATGANDSGFAQPGDFDGDVSAVAVSGGTLYVGGDFQHYRGVSAYGLAKISVANAALDTTFTKSTGINGFPASIAFSGSNVVVGGQFSTYRGTPLRHLAKLDMSSDVSDSAFTSLGGADGPVYSLSLTNGSLYVGGNYTTLHGFSRGGLGKINPATGAVDSAFAPSNNHLVRSHDTPVCGGPLCRRSIWNLRRAGHGAGGENQSGNGSPGFYLCSRNRRLSVRTGRFRVFNLCWRCLRGP